MNFGSNHIEFEGVVEVATFKSDETGFGILKMRVDRHRHPHVPRDKKGRTAIVGDLSLVEPGQKIVVNGVVKEHPKFGPQVEVEHFTLQEPKGETEIEAFLASKAFGIGPVFARRIVDAFGEDTLRVMDEEPDRLTQVEGIRAKRLERIKEMWAANRHLKEVLRFCSSVGISPKLAVKLAGHKRYGEHTEQRVRQDPYALARDIKGVGFRMADEVAKRLGVEEVSPLRIRAAAYHLIEEDMANHGDCFVYHRELVPKTVEFLEHPVIDQAMVEETLQEAFSLEILVNDGGRIYTPPMHRAEALSADVLNLLLSEPQSDQLRNPVMRSRAQEAARTSADVPLDEEQMQAVTMALTSKVSVLTGGPGVGKTTITKAIVAGFHAAHEPVTLMAPTGRAAKRMAEVIKHEAGTIHRTMFSIKKAAEEGLPLEELQLRGCIIVDEFSMVDLRLFHDMIQLIHPSATVVFIGDVDQLPSVGPGSVLRDLLDAETIPSKRLTRIYRQAENSDIITSAHAINRGHMPMLKILSRNENLPATDFFTVTKEDADALAACTVYCATTFAQYLGFDPRHDVQVLAPMHRGAIGVGVLNTRLQQILNPSPTQSFNRFSDEVWGVGDRLMNMRNDYDLDLMNGDLAHITGFEFDRHGQPELMWVEADNRAVPVPREKFGNFKLAYATTIHKVQGSEHPFVVMALHTSHYTLLQRNLLYTGITRSRTKVTLCCHPRALSQAIANDRVARRNSHLTARLNQMASAGRQGAA